MVGGGPGAFIGEVHRKAAALDGLTTLVAGAFSSNPAKSQQQGEVLHLDPARVYGSYEEMAEREAALPGDERIDFVSVVTPNFMHFPVAKAFIERGIHVVCDKPMTTTLEEAEELCRLVAAHDVVFALTHNYTGYPMVKQARAMVQNGELGEIHKVVVEYPQGWLATKLEDSRQQAGRMAHGSLERPACRRRWGTSVLMRKTLRAISPASKWSRSAQISIRSCRGGRSRTTPTC